jgi:hypothetical protein
MKCNLLLIQYNLKFAKNLLIFMIDLIQIKEEDLKNLINLRFSLLTLNFFRKVVQSYEDLSL